MRRLFLCIIAFMSALEMSAQVDSTSRAALVQKMEKYCETLLNYPVSQQCEEVDYIIGTCEDIATKGYIAEWLFDHFHDSKVMGLDAVAVHIYDEWFGKKGLKMSSELKGLSSGIYAQFNRQSLIGMKAPSIRLQYGDGTPVQLFAENSGRYSVLYFYAPDCAKCKIEDILLRNVIENRDCPIDVYAVCTSDNRQAWKEITDGSLDFTVRNTIIHHLWDPEGDKDWQLSYGILQTPRIFLIDGNGTIIGRGLDSPALDRMLETIFTPVKMTYGENESREFYMGIFDSYVQEQGYLSTANLMAVAGHIAERTLKEARDTVLYKQMEGDLLYYLNFSDETALRNGVSEFAKEFILDRSDIWNTPDDTLQVVGLANMMKELAERCPVGSKLPDIHIWGSRVTRQREYRVKEWRLGRIFPKVDYIMFYSPFCQDCREQLEYLKARHENGEKVKVLKVNMQEMEQEHPEQTQQLLDTFDLTFFPYITAVDSKGKVAEKYSTFK